MFMICLGGLIGNGCAAKKVLVKHCESRGSEIYECEELE